MAMLSTRRSSRCTTSRATRRSRQRGNSSHARTGRSSYGRATTRANGAALQRRLKHLVADAATLCDRGCNPMWWRLRPCVLEAAALCVPGATSSSTDDGSTHDVSAIGPGGCFGEMSLLYSAKRTASVAAQGRSSVWAMHREVHKGRPPQHVH
eukprot:scaffold49844_cov56-Phaeocystis_antarctica.AAC.1